MTDLKMQATLESPMKSVNILDPTEAETLSRQKKDADESDALLTEKIMHRLSAKHLLGNGNVAQITATVTAGVVTLTGHVVRAIHKTEAETLTGEVAGVSGVMNQLVVDHELRMAVAQALGHDPQTQDEQIQVSVQYGVVYLGGTVKNALLRSAVAQVAAALPQVRGLINLIQAPEIEISPDEDIFVQPRIGSEIYATDGQVGRVNQVIIDPQTRRVSAVVAPARFPVRQGPVQSPAAVREDPHLILIPIKSIRCAPSGTLFLKINSSEATHFIDFTPADFKTPPADWQPPYFYERADVFVPA